MPLASGEEAQTRRSLTAIPVSEMDDTLNLKASLPFKKLSTSFGRSINREVKLKTVSPSDGE
jgi:hypothetical protein